VVYLHIVVIRR